MTLQYLTGFGNEHATEAVAGVLPHQQNSPQRVAHGLYTEQLSGTAFTVPRHENLRSWLYRRRPSVRHITALTPLDADDPIAAGLVTAPIERPRGARQGSVAAQQLRWRPIDLHRHANASSDSTWLHSLVTVAANGDAHLQVGAANHLYFASESMVDEVFVNADGELLIVPQEGSLRFVTELGVIEAHPEEVVVIPRGIKFGVELVDGPARGYVCENYGAPFRLPEPGLIGKNALAQPRDFRYPVAAFDSDDRPVRLVFKYDGELFDTQLDHSPIDVVAWHGNYAPYVFNLRAYCPVGPVLFDHPDPSIFTVLTSPSDTSGVANIDFVVFRERWLVAEHSFRPPWFHSNVMHEYMGLIDGVYDAKLTGFAPGGVSIHNGFMPHGPDEGALAGGEADALDPTRLDQSLAFMFESRYMWRPTDWAMNRPERQVDYSATWQGIDRRDDL